MRNFAIIFVISVLAGFAQAQPAIATGGVISAATYAPPGLPSGPIAQGSMFVIFGSNMGPAALVQVTQYPVPTSLGGTSIQITVSGTISKALMVYSSAGQVSAILPSSTPVGTGTVTLTYNGQTSAPAPITVVARNFGMFTLNQQGFGPAVVTTATYQPITIGNSAKPGDTLVLWGTGVGPYTGDESQAPVQTNMPGVTVYVGNQLANVLYAGRAFSSGEDQINFTVPANLSGCYVPIAVVVNGIASNFGSISVAANGGVCSDPIGLPASALSKVLNGGNLKVGLVELQRVAFNATIPILGAINIKQDAGSAYFYNFTPQTLVSAPGLTQASAFGSCTVLVCRASTCIPDATAQSIARLDAGTKVTMTGPSGAADVPLVSKGEYHGLLGDQGLAGSSYIVPGAYTATVAGGPDVPGFTANLTVGTPVTFSNLSTFTTTTSRTQPITVTWSGGNAGDYVAVSGSSATSDGTASTTFVCTEKASVGTLTVPSWVVSTLPVTGQIVQSGITIPGGFLLLGNYPSGSTFTAPGLDVGIFAQTVVNGLNTSFK